MLLRNCMKQFVFAMLFCLSGRTMEAKGLFANNLSVPVEIYVNNIFHKKIAPRTEILMLGVSEFTVYIPNAKESIFVEKNSDYYYTWTYLDVDEIRVQTIEEIQNYSNAAKTFNPRTGEPHPLGDDFAAFLQERWGRIKKYNLTLKRLKQFTH